jgi:hypothetical protein
MDEMPAADQTGVPHGPIAGQEVADDLQVEHDGDETSAKKDDLIRTISLRIDAICSQLNRRVRPHRFVQALDFATSVYSEQITYTVPVVRTPVNLYVSSDIRSIKIATYFSDDSLSRVSSLLDGPPSLASFSEGEWVTFADRLFDTVVEQLREAYDATSAQVAPPGTVAHQVIDELLERERIRQKLNRIDKAVQQAEESVASISEAAGDVAEGSLSKYFSSHGDRERLAAEIARGAVVLIALLITVFLFVEFRSVSDGFSWLDLARKIALTLPGVGLAAYLARESNKHRKNADWAATIAVQLNTVRPYVDELPAELREQIRTELGKRVFSAQAPQVRADAESTPSVIPDVRSLIARKDAEDK